MSYNINYYSADKAKKRDKYFATNPIFYNQGLDTNKKFFQYIIEAINNIKHKKPSKIIKILDLGTGTGYVPEILSKIDKTKFKIIGIDLSTQMIENAKNKIKDQRITFVVGDNKHLPFKPESFDIITNKLSTQFSIKEMARVLKKGGHFIFKEYGVNKGFKEIRELFPHRYAKIKKTPFDFYRELYELEFNEISFKSFFIKRTYKLKEIKKIFEMANLINNFNDQDMLKIKNKLGNSIKVFSDPFIIYARK